MVFSLRKRQRPQVVRQMLDLMQVGWRCPFSHGFLTYQKTCLEERNLTEKLEKTKGL